jgi:isoleucyl-tRNA synthetase
MASPVFEKVPSELNFPRDERATLDFWKRERIFERSLEERKGQPTFVFYEGPPTANGLPHNGHVLTRVIKDLFPRYKTMRGFHVPRKAGWDTHGLPVEVEVEKELRIHGKAAIEEYGVEPFIAKCVQSVFRYTSEWEHLTERVGFWVDLPTAYVTFHKSYVESVWWALSELFKKGLLYQGHKVVWWWAQGGTALSSGEVGLGYKEVLDPSAYVAFPLKPGALDGMKVGAGEEELSLLIWTTTPWTLPSNMFVAVNAAFDYAIVRFGDRLFVVAEKLVVALGKKLKAELTIERVVKGAALEGLEYEPPFADDYVGARALDASVTRVSGPPTSAFWRVLLTDFVSLDAGTGLVHVAPAFGEDDHRAYTREVRLLRGKDPLPLLCAVAPDGTFNDRLPRYAGRWVKDCDKEILGELKVRGALVHTEQYKHDYPFCWRSDQDPLIQYARPAWYIKTTALKDAAIANNRTVSWLPEHIKEGRFGDFLAHNVDWALSRERYWGTPLNVWICTKDEEHRHAPTGTKEILERNPRAFDRFDAAKKVDPTLSEHLVVHKPWIDEVVFACPTPGCGAEMRRVPEVIDCWFDSGCMPFAQWGFPHQGQDEFRQSFPADFISEAIDQTRGWFYSLLMISTLVFDEATQTKLGLSPVRAYPLPYKTCIVLGHVSDKEGKKESKSKGNYTPPEIILDAVQMDFALLGRHDASTLKGVSWKEGESGAFIAVEDLDGLDLNDGAKVTLRGPSGATEATLKAKKGLPRRVIVLDEGSYAALGVVPTTTPDVKPVEVPRLPKGERVTVIDPTTPAPGADAFRWFFYASGPPWNATRHSLSNVRALQKEFLVKLRNVYSFFTIYANLDGFDPHTSVPPIERSELDRWILVELAQTVETVTARLDAYDIYPATMALTDLVDALSNWYVRRNRARFWSSGWSDDKAGAYFTLHEVLVTLSRIIAPFVPFFAEAMHQNLVVLPARAHDQAVPASVHLTTFPEPDKTWLEDAAARGLSRKVRAVRDLVSLGLQVRTQAKLKVRQPLRQAYAIVVDPSLFEGSAVQQLKEELNVLLFHPVPLARADEFVEFRVKPSFRALGARGLGKEAQALKGSMGKMSSAEAAVFASKVLAGGSADADGIALERGDVEIELVAKPGFAAAGDRAGVIVLDTKLDAELEDLGMLRELISRVQGARKDLDLGYADRIRLYIETDGRLKDVATRYAIALAAEVLADKVLFEPTPAGAHVVDSVVEGTSVTLGIARA